MKISRFHSLREEFFTLKHRVKFPGYKEIAERWLNSDDSKKVMPHIESDGRNGTLTVCSDYTTGKPRIYFNDKGQPNGFDIEIAMRFAAFLGKKFKAEDLPFAAIIPGIQTGKADCGISGMFITPERAEKIDFSDPYHSGSVLAVIRKSDAEPTQAASGGIRSNDDVKNKKIAVALGSVQEMVADRHFPDATILAFNSNADCVAAVCSGKADVCIMEGDVAVELARTHPVLDYLREPVCESPFGAVFRKGNDVLREEYNAFLKKIRADGTYKEVDERWLGHGVDGSVIPPIDNPENNGTLVMAADYTVGAPHLFYDARHRPSGFDTELALRFAASLGKKLKIEDMPLTGLIPALQNGSVDFIHSSLTITEERQRRADFSDPYFASTLHIVFRKDAGAAEKTTDPASGIVGVFHGIVRWFSDGIEANLLRENRYLLVLEGLGTTLVIAVCSMILGTGVGAIVCAMLMSRRHFVRSAAKLYIALLWGTPSLVLLMFFYYVFFASIEISPIVVATLAFGLNIGANVAEIMFAGVRSVDPGQIEAGKAMGMSSFQTFRWITFPQATSLVLPMYQAAFSTLLRGTSVVGYIAIRDLTKAGDLIRSRTFDAVFPLMLIAVLYLLMSYLTSLGFSWLGARRKE